MKKIWFRSILASVSITSLMFTFQACYGTASDHYDDIVIEGKVLSKTTGLPIEGIKVSIDSTGQYELTDSAGKYYFWTEKAYKARILFEDIDSNINQHYQSLDTSFTKLNEDLTLNVSLEEI